MGTEFDHFGPEAATRYFEDKLLKAETLTIEEYSCLQNRRLLFHVLAEVGFTNYHEEWWHFDYGNQFWGKITGKQAIYGPVYPYIDIP
jgi:D-alanyl-D-alanine dipeptidase